MKMEQISSPKLEEKIKAKKETPTVGPSDAQMPTDVPFDAAKVGPSVETKEVSSSKAQKQMNYYENMMAEMQKKMEAIAKEEVVQGVKVEVVEEEEDQGKEEIE